MVEMLVGMELRHRLAMGADPWLMQEAMLLGMNLGMALRFAVPAGLFAEAGLGAGKLGESRR